MKIKKFNDNKIVNLSPNEIHEISGGINRPKCIKVTTYSVITAIGITGVIITYTVTSMPQSWSSLLGSISGTVLGAGASELCSILKEWGTEANAQTPLLVRVVGPAISKLKLNEKDGV